MNRYVKFLRVALGAVLALVAAVLLGVTAMHAQSSKKAGIDVPVQIVEQWFKRLGLLNGSNGCDVAVEYDALNQARVTDCTDAANLADLKMRAYTLTGIPSNQGVAASDVSFTKSVTGIANNTFTDAFKVTVPNSANSATIPVVIHATLGAGGSVGADECAATAYGQIVIARTSGLATVATATTLSNTGSSCVAGAETITLSYQVSSITGANSATQTFTVQVKILANGFATNHVAIVSGSVVNHNGSGVTVS